MFINRICRGGKSFGYHYLDQAPLLFPNANLAVVGSMNWYDYSWAIERMKAEVPDWEWHLKNKAFTRGRHNDGRFVRWPTDDVAFTRMIVNTFEQHLTQALTQVEHALVMTHHPAFQGISFPRSAPAQGLDSLLWEGCPARLRIVLKHAQAHPSSSATHRERALLGRARLQHRRRLPLQRMLMLDWPTRTIETFIFGDPNRRRNP